MAPPAGPRGLFAGNQLGLMRDPMGALAKLATHGDIVLFRMFGTQRIWLANHPDLVQEVLVTRSKDYRKGRGLQAAKRLLGEGLLTSEGDLHREQRKVMQPMFHHERIAGYADAMVRHAARARERFEPGQEHDMSQEMARLTLGIVAQTLFDADVEGDAADIGSALTDALVAFRSARLPVSELVSRLPTPSNVRLQRARVRLDAVIHRLIAERRGEEGSDLLRLLLGAQHEDGGGMSDAQVRDEALTILLAGHETTAQALTWTWYLLGQHAEVEERLHAELDDVLHGRLPAAGDVPRLAYTAQVLAESMRLYPPAWILTRQAVRDTGIAGQAVRRGDSVIVSEWLVHRDARWWPEPERFDPGRFAEEQEKARHEFAYFPFGGGPRLCIGEPFAWMEGTLLLATLAQRWRFRIVPGHPVELLPLITLRPRHGMRMVAHALPRRGRA
ncbi:MAG: cytochrome P450 [Halobacteriales archaeon]|nr:cytochrome P450 [Halobacteriales archaeon]